MAASISELRCLDIAPVRHRDATAPPDGLNDRVIHAQAVEF